jgi:tRNA-splicing ligase RtcB
MVSKKDFRKITDWLWEIPKTFRQDMRVPARIYVSGKMLEDIFKDRSIEQLINVATLPGIVDYSLAMPDMHEGYGFPIGGVAAMRTSDGVISPGGVGYDINCTSGNTRILLEHGAYLPIKKLGDNWKKFQVSHINLNKFNQNTSPLIHFLKRLCNPSILRFTTTAGNKIEVTGDHPIYTPKGMKEAKYLKQNEKVVVWPFKGVLYREPPNKTILSESNFRRILINLGKTTKGSAIQQIISKIKALDILPLKYNSPQLPYFLKIMGYVLGDGSISFINNKKGTVWFYGNPEDLETIRQDIKKIGFIPSKIYNRTRNHKITTHYQKYQFSRTEYSIKVVSSTFAGLLVALGLPFGSKTLQKYRIPKWIFRCQLWQKRLFLASFFGAELGCPATLNNYNFYAPQLNMSKSVKFLSNGKYFLKQISSLLKEFEVRCAPTVEVEGYSLSGVNKASGLRLIILNNPKNLLNLFEKIGYEYNFKKQKEACFAIHYLKLKQRVVNLRASIRKKAETLYKKKGDFKEVKEKFLSEYTPAQFLWHSIFTCHRGNPRIAFNFPSFEEYKKEFSMGENGLVWDQIEKIEKISYKDFVYDFTVNHPDHNFIANNFVVSNCGMKLLKSEITEREIQPYLENLAEEIQKEVPSGLGKGRQLKLDVASINKILEEGAQKLVEQGYGEKGDLENCESQGNLPSADSSLVSDHAKNRGRDQVGTLGSGNHFLEVQKVEEIFDEKTAKVFGLFKDQIVIMIHTGSRGLGHQIATDYIKVMMKAMPKYGIHLPDRELAACPIKSREGQNYFSAMACGANYAWANRQMIAHFVRKAWKAILGEKTSPLVSLYDVAHNIAKFEKHEVKGKETELCLHRKGATRAFPGQPVLIPGSMGTASYVLVGVEEGKDSFFSTNHGAGRTMSRKEATRRVSGQEVIKRLESKGIIVKCQNFRGIAEEAPIAYKDVDDVVEVVHNAGLSKKVVRLRPLAVIKGE